jgi:hypothetical protein
MNKGKSLNAFIQNMQCSNYKQFGVIFLPLVADYPYVTQGKVAHSCVVTMPISTMKNGSSMVCIWRYGSREMLMHGLVRWDGDRRKG